MDSFGSDCLNSGLRRSCWPKGGHRGHRGHRAHRTNGTLPPKLFRAIVNSLGEAVVDLPIGFGTYSQPPVITCYIGDPVGFPGTWLIVSTDLSPLGAVTSIFWVSNHWRVGLQGGVPQGWTFLVEAVW